MAKAKLDENKQTVVIQQNMKLLRKIRSAVKELSSDKSSGEWRLGGMKGLDGEVFVALRAARAELDRTKDLYDEKKVDIRNRLRDKYEIEAKQKLADEAYKELRAAEIQYQEELGPEVDQIEQTVEFKKVQSHYQDARSKAEKEAHKLYKELIRLEVLAESGKTPDKVAEQILALAKALGLVNQDD